MHAYAVLQTVVCSPRGIPPFSCSSPPSATTGVASWLVLKRPALVQTLWKRKFMTNPILRATLIDTAYLTGFEGALFNVPATVSANLDSRLLPGTEPHEMLHRLNTLLEDEGIEGVVVVESHSQRGAVSPRTDPVYEALAKRVVEGMPEAVAGPVLSPGFTDSIYLRELGVHAYGLVPFILTERDLRSMHGDDERVSVENLERGARVLFSAITDVAQGPNGQWSGPPVPLHHHAPPSPRFDRDSPPHAHRVAVQPTGINMRALDTIRAWCLLFVGTLFLALCATVPRSAWAQDAVPPEPSPGCPGCSRHTPPTAASPLVATPPVCGRVS